MVILETNLNKIVHSGLCFVNIVALTKTNVLVPVEQPSDWGFL